MTIEIDEELARDLFIALVAYSKITLEASKNSDGDPDAQLAAVKVAISVSKFAASLADGFES